MLHRNKALTFTSTACCLLLLLSSTPKDGVPVAVVPGLFLRITQHLVGLLYLCKVGRGFGLSVRVLIYSTNR
jgi:hypothetical protein